MREFGATNSPLLPAAEPPPAVSLLPVLSLPHHPPQYRPMPSSHHQSAQNSGSSYFSMYFPSFSSVESLPLKILRVYREGKEFFQRKQDIIHLQESLIGESVIKLSFQSLKTNSECESFQQAMCSKLPHLALSAMELAAHEIYYPERIRNQAAKIVIRIYNFGKVPFLLRDLKSNNVNKFVRVEGTVARVSRILPVGKSIEFECPKCGDVQIVKFDEGIYDPPSSCAAPNCNARSLKPIKSSVKSSDWQRVRVQELRQEDDEPGRMPRSVDIELESDLVDTCIPGDIISVCGILKSRKLPKRFRNGKSEKQQFFLFIQGNSVSNAKDDDSESQMQIVQFSPKDLEFCKKIITETPDIFSLMINSLCPAIYGHEMVKAGLCLALFGGEAKLTEDSRGLQSVRGDIHVLICGDPALGKSQMLRAVSTLSPRGVYVSGNTSSKQGMTVTVVREKSTGEYTLEAGALVLADQGICCVDEFDKMKKDDHKALLEAMEQQSISIAKAGIVCHLPSRCSVMAAANPVGGHYTQSKSLSENIRMDPALLSRFDLLFVLLDKPEDDTDALISSHVFGQHATHAVNATSSKKTTTFGAAPGVLPMDNSSLFADEEVTTDLLRKRFRITDANSMEPIPHALLRKYVAYSKKYCHPKIGRMAKEEISEFYVQLRKKYSGPHHAPVTTRQLESIIRLCQARARVEMRDFVTRKDALEVIAIMKASMFDVLDDLGALDMRSRSPQSTKKGSSFQRETNRYIDALLLQAQNRGSDIFSVSEAREVAQRAGINTGDSFTRFLERLNLAGRILMKPGGCYKVVGVS